MNTTNYEGLEGGYSVPALPETNKADIQIPCVVIELDAFELDI